MNVSPVTYADSKFCRDSESRFWVDVLFKDESELSDLIDNLTKLREAEDCDHIHLQDHNLSPSSPPSSAEIVFHKPGKVFKERKKLIANKPVEATA